MPFATSSDHPLRTLSGALALLAACALPGAALADWRPTLEAGTEVRDGNASQRLRGTLSEPTRPLTRALGIEFIRDDAGNTLVLDGSARYWVTRGAYGLLDTRYLYDEALGIDWPDVDGVDEPTLSDRDAAAPAFADQPDKF